VIGPERLPGAIRTGSVWLSRIKRGFNELKHEVERELHNDAIMRELESTRQQIEEQARSIGQDVQETVERAAADDDGAGGKPQ